MKQWGTNDINAWAFQQNVYFVLQRNQDDEATGVFSREQVESPECEWQRGQVCTSRESERRLAKWGSPLFCTSLWSPSSRPEPQWGVQAGPPGYSLYRQRKAEGVGGGSNITSVQLLLNLTCTLKDWTKSNYYIYSGSHCCGVQALVCFFLSIFLLLCKDTRHDPSTPANRCKHQDFFPQTIENKQFFFTDEWYF